MEYLLRNGGRVIIRKPEVEDAEAIINVISTADTETLFLARNPGEFHFTVDQEKAMIARVLEDENKEWFVAEYDGKVVGQCTALIPNGNQRFRHRAEVAFVVLKDYCDIGIGGKMMQECLKWCENKGCEQVELTVVSGNERAKRMYENFGFQVYGTHPNALKYPDGTYADEYYMVKKLK